ncbi:MAG: nuclear transport factor 2 family protein [Bacteroidota bacterium]
MKRRDFTEKALIVSGALAVGVSSAAQTFEKITTTKKFDFMSPTHPNLKLIQQFFEAYGNNDIDAIKKVVSSDIKWHIPGKHPLSGTKNGIDELLGFFQKLHKARFKAEPIIMGVNDMYVIDCHSNWSNIEDGENLNAMSCLLWKIESNKIVEVHNFPENQYVVDAFFSKVYG